MSNTEITAVGIDVSKDKSTVAVRRPGGRIVMKPFTVLHTAEGLTELTNTLRGIGGEIRVVMEHTGMYWRPVALTLKQSGSFVSVVNAMLIHDFFMELGEAYLSLLSLKFLQENTSIWIDVLEELCYYMYDKILASYKAER